MVLPIVIPIVRFVVGKSGRAVIRPVQRTAFKFCQGLFVFYFLFFIFCFSDRTMVLSITVTKVYDKGALAPMNKFVCKLHGYIVYFI